MSRPVENGFCVILLYKAQKDEGLDMQALRIFGAENQWLEEVFDLPSVLG